MASDGPVIGGGVAHHPGAPWQTRRFWAMEVGAHGAQAWPEVDGSWLKGFLVTWKPHGNRGSFGSAVVGACGGQAWLHIDGSLVEGSLIIQVPHYRQGFFLADPKGSLQGSGMESC